MSEKNIVQNEVNNGDIDVISSPASTNTPGIAYFNPEDFTVDTDGYVSSRQKVGAIQYIGTITGISGSSFEWEITKDFSPKKLADVKLNDLVLLTQDYEEYEAGAVFAVSDLTYPYLHTKNTPEFSIRGSNGAVGPQGSQGADGVTPDISVSASVSQTTGTATVVVSKSGTLAEPKFDLAFSGIKGEVGEQGSKGDTGDPGTNLYVHMEIEDGKLYLLSDSVMSNEFMLEDGCLYLEDA